MDQELLQAAQGGDRRARERLWSELMTSLGDYFLRRTQDSEVAMELTQLTVTDLLKKSVIEEISTAGEVSGYVYGYAEKQLRRYQTELRRARRREAWLAARGIELELLGHSSMEGDFKYLELGELIDDLVAKLPSTLRQVWELRVGGYSYKKMARLIGNSESTAQRRFEAAQRRLKREYERMRRTRPEFRSPLEIAS